MFVSLCSKKNNQKKNRGKLSLNTQNAANYFYELVGY